MNRIQLPLADHVGVSDQTFMKLLNAAGIYDRRQIEWYDKFNRYGCLDPYNNVTNTREYIFFTKPDLHIFENRSTSSVLNTELETYPIFADAMVRYNNVLKQLQYSVNNPKHAFVNLLSNSVKSTLDLPGISVNDVQTSENIYGTFMTYRRSSLTSDEQHEFSLEFEDTKYTEVYMWFRLYDEYCKLKDLGMVTPPDISYIINKILHDQMSVFKFIVGDDGETIIYWCKLWGVYPKGVPRDAFSDLSGNNGLRFSVSFKSQFVDDMDPSILGDFNAVTIGSGNGPRASEILPVYDTEINSVSGEWAGLPFVIRDQRVTSSNAVYKLKWGRS